MDIDPCTYNLSVEHLAEKLAQAEESGRLPKVVIPVHLCGQSCDMVSIHALSQRYGFKIIEDASHAIGGKYRGELIGNCRYSNITVFSFHPVKIITTGEGGMVLTNDAKLAERMRLLRTHGITREPGLMEGESHGPWYYQQVDLGYNYRITDIQAALGYSQMARLDTFVARREELASRYDSALKDLTLDLPGRHPDCCSAWHLYVIKLLRDDGGQSRLKVFEALCAAGIGVNVHYIPVHTQPFYRKLGHKIGDFPEAEKYYANAISLPLYSGLADKDQNYVIETLWRIIGEENGDLATRQA